MTLTKQSKCDSCYAVIILVLSGTAFSEQEIEVCKDKAIFSMAMQKRNRIKIACVEVNIIVANVFFSFLSIVGQVGQNVSLPLWIDSTISSHGTQPNKTQRNYSATGFGQKSGIRPYFTYSSNSSGGESGRYEPRVDSFFVYSFACLAFVVIFGVALICIRLFRPQLLGDAERNFPHSQLFLVGFFAALSGVLVVFASSGKRTAPYLQSILGNFMIPLTMALR